MKTDPDDSAYPTQMWDEELKEATWLDGGLSKREHFAALAMQGLLAGVYSSKEMLNEFTKEKHSPGDDLMRRSYLSGCEAISRNALSYADALIQALNQEGK